MLYIFTLIVCIYCAIHFDVLNKKNKRKSAYNGLLIWFIAISAFQFKVGTDMVYYMYEYENLNLNGFTINNLISNNGSRQPGWMTLCYFCRFITKDFLLLKLIQAIFVNIAIFSFFKRETKYVFVAIFLYALISYLVINFNLMRQSIALGFALYGFSYLRKKKYIKYYIFVLLAFLFHNSALILIPLPLINLFNSSSNRSYSKKITYILISAFIVILCALSFLNLEDILYHLLFSGFLGDHNSSAGLAYMSRDRLGIQSSFSIISIQRIIMIVAVLYYMKKYNNHYYGILGLIYILFQILTGLLPILWRFRVYFDFPYYIILSQLIVDLPRIRNKISSVALIAIMTVVIYFPLRDYLTPFENSKYRYIDQYYPYHTIFDKEFDETKQHYFDTMTL